MVSRDALLNREDLTLTRSLVEGLVAPRTCAVRAVTHSVTLDLTGSLKRV